MTDVSPETARQVLDLPMPDGNDADAATIRDYLIKLLTLAWQEADNFSGKKPFGSSDWEADLQLPLLKAGLIGGSLDEFGYIDDLDVEAADRLILAAIAELGRAA